MQTRTKTQAGRRTSCLCFLLHLGGSSCAEAGTPAMRISPVSIVDRFTVCSETSFSLGFWAADPGNGIVAQALLSVSRHSASLFRPQGALGSGPKPAQGRESGKLA